MNSFKKKTSSTVTNPVSHPFENRLYHPIKFPKEEVLFAAVSAHGKRNGFALKLISYLWINSIQKSKKDCVFNQQIILR